MKKCLLLLSVLLSLCACKHYKTVPVTLPDGFVVQAWVADTPAKQERGLMFVKNLPENKGMLFVFDNDQDLTFWMKNTLIDLDMIFIDSNKIVTNVVAQVPHSYTYTPDEQIAYALGYGQYVLELPANAAAQHNITPGNNLLFNYEK